MSYFESTGRNFFRIYTIFIILALQGRQFEAKRVLDIYTTLFSYMLPKSNEAILLANCSLTPIVGIQSNRTAKSKPRTHQAINLNVEFAYDIIDIQAHVNISIERGGRYDTYLSTALDLCKLRYEKVEQPLVRYLRDEFIRLMKPNSNCPFKKNILYEMNNLVLSSRFLLAYTPPLNWKADFKLWLNGQYSVAYAVTGKIEWIDI